MTSETTIAAIRFGYGLGPGVRPVGPDLPEALLSGLSGTDVMARRYPVKSTREAVALARAMRMAKRKAKKAPRGSGGAAGSEERKRRLLARQVSGLGLLHGIARILDSETAFRERLVWFWEDHFTAVAKNLAMRLAAPAYVDEAIRPHVAGRFPDMLKAVVTHPFMLTYLDQSASVGPNSRLGKRRGAGLNENLARELMELHTLGVGASYTQDDVRQLAELLTGLSFRPGKGFVFNPLMAEPGAETVLGKRYGGKGRARLEDILAVLDDLALHPDTAAHVSRKLAVHFVSDTPDPALVGAITAAYRDSGGNLIACYRAMLEHPAAWGPLGNKAKKPFDFIASALVAFGLRGQDLLGLKEREQIRLLARPLQAMGQPFMGSRGPDGWPEEAENWITPQGLAVRIAWSTDVAERLAGRAGDPRSFLDSTLGDAAGAGLRRAVAEAPGRAEGIALVLSSAEFNRR